MDSNLREALVRNEWTVTKGGQGQDVVIGSRTSVTPSRIGSATYLDAKFSI